MNHNQLFEIAQYLDPRCYDIVRRRDALKQIIGIPSIEAQIYDAWSAGVETPTPGKQDTQLSNRSASRHSSEQASTSCYGIRQGLYDALVDADPELNVIFQMFEFSVFGIICLNLFIFFSFSSSH